MMDSSFESQTASASQCHLLSDVRYRICQRTINTAHCSVYSNQQGCTGFRLRLRLESGTFPNPAEIRLRQKIPPKTNRLVLADLKSRFFSDIRYSQILSLEYLIDFSLSKIKLLTQYVMFTLLWHKLLLRECM